MATGTSTTAILTPRRGGRLAGFGLIALGFAPLAIIVGGVILIGFLMLQTVGIVTARIATISQIATQDIEPQIQAVQAAYGKLAAEAGAMKGQLDKALSTLTKPQGLTIEVGEFGTTPSPQIRIPDHSIALGPGGAVKFEDGQLFNKALPSVRIPAEPVTLSIGPIQAAFGPLGPDGPVGQAIGKATGELGATLDAAGKLRQPLLAIKDAVLTIPEPLRGAFDRLVIIFTAGAVALAAVLIAYFIVATVLIVRGWGAASGSYRTGGVLGLLFYSHRAIVGRGMNALFARPPIKSLSEEIEELRTELNLLSAELKNLSN